MPVDAQPQQWSQMQERGTYLGLATLFYIYKFFGINALYFILYFIVGFYFLFGAVARRSSLQFLNNMHEYKGKKSSWKKPPGLLQSYRHFMSFARIACDKIIVWTGHYRLEDLKVSGYDVYQEYQERGQGSLLIVSHLGNIDICRAFAGGVKKMKMTVLVHSAHAPNFQKMMTKVSGRASTIEMIEVNNITPDLIIYLREKIQTGENIAITGDRTAVESSGRYEMFRFLGKEAPFAQGPFILAELLECPVFAVFNMKEGKTYHAFFHFMAENFKAPREMRSINIKKHMEDYVKLLEYYTCSYPMQWFNFYDYWKKP